MLLLRCFFPRRNFLISVTGPFRPTQMGRRRQFLWRFFRKTDYESRMQTHAEAATPSVSFSARERVCVSVPIPRTTFRISSFPTPTVKSGRCFLNCTAWSEGEHRLFLPRPLLWTDPPRRREGTDEVTSSSFLTYCFLSPLLRSPSFQSFLSLLCRDRA